MFLRWEFDDGKDDANVDEEGAYCDEEKKSISEKLISKILVSKKLIVQFTD